MRRFSRVVTQRVGALDDHFLDLDRPLGEARVLWEIGEQGSDVRRLRAQLDLDSGYLSRVLRSLEATGLVTVTPSAPDRRVRTARLTKKGRTHRAALDRRADTSAWSLLEPLSHPDRARLVDAMATVERLLIAALVEFVEIDPGQPDARYCLQQYFAEIDDRFEGGFDAALSLAPEADVFRRPAGAFLVARLHGEPIGCGALKLPSGQPPEVKRMWVAPTARGLGVGRRLLAALEAVAAATGSMTIRLETNQVLGEAIGLYRSSGYREVEAFNDERYAHHWFEKELTLVSRSARRGRGSRTGGDSTPRR